MGCLPHWQNALTPSSSNVGTRHLRHVADESCGVKKSRRPRFALVKRKLTIVAQAYLSALREYLLLGSRVSLQPALELGCRAFVLGLQPSELSGMHHRALAKLKLPAGAAISVKRAGRFLKDALIPLVKLNHTGCQGKERIKHLNRSLNQKTAQLNTTKSQLQEGIAKREILEMELSIKTNLLGTLLRESLELQDGLRKLTHGAFTAQEKERRRLSRELRNNIAQTLLGLNVRLINLKHEAKHKVHALKHRITATQRVVAGSVKTMRQLARKNQHS